MSKTFSLVLTCFFIGCTTAQTNVQSVPSSTASNIRVTPFRTSPILVPVTADGATLRSLISDAYDLASRSGDLTASYLINQARGTEKSFMGLTLNDLAQMSKEVDALTEQQLYVGDKVVIIVRGNSRHIFHEDLVLQTALGSVRALPGDEVVIMPYQSLAKLYQDGRQNGQMRLRLLGRNDQNVQLPYKDVKTGADLVPELDSLSGTFAVYAASELQPSVVVISRTYDIWADTIVLPCYVVSKPGDYKHLTAAAELVDQRRITNGNASLQITKVFDGDIVNFTRLENIPMVVAGITQPLPTRVGGSPLAAAQKQCPVVQRLNPSGVVPASFNFITHPFSAGTLFPAH